MNPYKLPQELKKIIAYYHAWDPVKFEFLEFSLNQTSRSNFIARHFNTDRQINQNTVKFEIDFFNYIITQEVEFIQDKDVALLLSGIKKSLCSLESNSFHQFFGDLFIGKLLNIQGMLSLSEPEIRHTLKAHDLPAIIASSDTETLRRMRTVYINQPEKEEEEEAMFKATLILYQQTEEKKEKQYILNDLLEKTNIGHVMRVLAIIFQDIDTEKKPIFIQHVLHMIGTEARTLKQAALQAAGTLYSKDITPDEKEEIIQAVMLVLKNESNFFDVDLAALQAAALFYKATTDLNQETIVNAYHRLTQKLPRLLTSKEGGWLKKQLNLPEPAEALDSLDIDAWNKEQEEALIEKTKEQQNTIISLMKQNGLDENKIRLLVKAYNFATAAQKTIIKNQLLIGIESTNTKVQIASLERILYVWNIKDPMMDSTTRQQIINKIKGLLQHDNSTIQRSAIRILCDLCRKMILYSKEEELITDLIETIISVTLTDCTRGPRVFIEVFHKATPTQREKMIDYAQDALKQLKDSLSKRDRIVEDLLSLSRQTSDVVKRQAIWSSIQETVSFDKKWWFQYYMDIQWSENLSKSVHVFLDLPEEKIPLVRRLQSIELKKCVLSCELSRDPLSISHSNIQMVNRAFSGNSYLQETQLESLLKKIGLTLKKLESCVAPEFFLKCKKFISSTKGNHSPLIFQNSSDGSQESAHESNESSMQPTTKPSTPVRRA